MRAMENALSIMPAKCIKTYKVWMCYCSLTVTWSSSRRAALLRITVMV